MMVVGLFALSLVMIVGGIASIVQGFPYVRLESGLAMVIGGATAASAGAILLGLSAVVQRLKRLEEALGSPRLGSTPAFPEAFAAIPMAPPAAAASVAAAAGVAEPAVGTVSRSAPEPNFDFVEPRDGTKTQVDDEPALSGLSPPAAPPPATLAPTVAAPDPALPHASEQDLFADRDPVAQKAGVAEEGLTLRSSLDDASTPSPSPQATEKPADPPQVVGTYSSGGNTYVMYADGIIEADTPHGRFTFNSLDELKAFVEAGGENDARGAA